MDIVELWKIYWPNWTVTSVLVGVILITVLIFPAFSEMLAGNKSRRSFAAGLVLLIWLYWVYASCVFCRHAYDSYHYILRPFWSYELILRDHNSFMLQEIVLNSIMLLPVGVLFPVAVQERKLSVTVLFGFLCSAGIELLQLLLRRGLFEWDDMFHNTLGVAAGFFLIEGVYALASLGRRLYLQREERSSKNVG